MEGTIASSSEVGARWAHSESQAARWRDGYRTFLSDRVRTHLPFDDLTENEKSLLNDALLTRRPDLAPDIHRHGRYVCQSWSKEKLGQTRTIIRMAPDRNTNIPFLSFVACPRFAEDSDPRVQADLVPFENPFIQNEPIVVISCYGPDILIDGYLRSVLFMRTPDPNFKILVWYPFPTGS